MKLDDVRKTLLQFENVVKFVQEPFVNVAHLPNLIDAISSMER
jgi:hypothetical protein